MSLPYQLFGEIGNHPLGPAIALWRNGFSERGNLSYAHQCLNLSPGPDTKARTVHRSIGGPLQTESAGSYLRRKQGAERVRARPLGELVWAVSEKADAGQRHRLLVFRRNAFYCQLNRITTR